MIILTGIGIATAEERLVNENKRSLLLHPVRMRIVQALAARPRTPLQLVEGLGDVPQATVYRHLRRLHDAAIVEVVGERQVRGGTERTYSLVSDAASLGPSDLEDASPEEHFELFATFVGTLLTDYSAYLRDNQATDLEKDRVGFRRIPLWLSDAEFDDFARAVSAAISPYLGNEPDERRRLRQLSIVVMPDDR